MDTLATSSTLSFEDPSILKSSQPHDDMTSVDSLKTSRSSYLPNFVRIDVDNSKHSKDVGNTRGSTSNVSPQIQASAYINDTETLSVPRDDTNTAEQGYTELHPTTSTTLLSTTPQTEANRHASSPIVPTLAPATILALQPASPPSQPQLESESTNLSSNPVASSAISILSASGTLVSHEVQGRLSTSTTHPPHPLSQTTTAHTLSVSSVPFDPQQFKATLQKLTALTEQFEALNDQVLDALTSYDESRLGLDFESAAGSHLATEPTTKDESSTDLEIERRVVAQSLVELIFSSWSRLAGAGSTTVYPTLNLPIRTPPPAQKMDPLELEDEGRVRSLRSRHLNNLLSTSLSPTEADRLSSKFERDQDRMTKITEQLQGLWLEILLVLSKPSSTVINSSNKAGDVSSESDEGDNDSFGKRFFRIGKSKRQAFKHQHQQHQQRQQHQHQHHVQ
ncbi:hypothetical protein BG015_009216 [Linnemannia schmuckeri]|uniref:Uncharacterized protein n=1 Tax=Linnemannia schmuckeri TaxID=64567 RepID=A0A9P5V9R7_9FUNG|nr:hypothetical protein BG015_009216 [Linnemannia schmuckeri]